MRLLLILLIVPGLPVFLSAQVVLTGKVMDSKSDLPLEGVTIENKNKRLLRKSGINGQYAILTSDKDTLIFSFTGYRADTIVVLTDLIQNGLDIGLKALPPMLLDTVTVRASTYTEDSLRRREEYSAFYKKPLPGITGGNTPVGFGISFSPFSYFSGKEKAKRKLKKRLAYNEEQAYIDHFFSPSFVQRLTGLSGEELQRFMLKYRPSYDFVRSNTNDDLVRYINESLKTFKKSR